MKVKYINKKNELWLIYWNTYNVFSIIISKDEKWNKYYIKADWPKYIYPYDISDFEIVDWNISQYWIFNRNNLWDFIIWPKEIYENQYFWSEYYDDKELNTNIIDKYYKIAKDELFNI